MFRTASLAGLVAILAAALVAATVGAVFGVGTPARTSLEVSAVPQNPELGAGHSAGDAEHNEADEVFYVVAYHWGWAVFTEDGSELDNIRVKDGTIVEIYAANVEARDAINKLPAPVAAAIQDTDWHARARKAVEAGLVPLPEGVTVEEALRAGHEESGGEAHEEEPGRDAHDDASEEDSLEEPILPYMEDHGFLIPWYGVSEYLDDEAQEPTRVVFTADKNKIKEYGAANQRSVQFVCTNYCGLGHTYMAQTMLLVD